LVDFIAYVMTQYHKTIKCIQSDNGLEFNFYESRGIVHQTTCIETP